MQASTEPTNIDKFLLGKISRNENNKINLKNAVNPPAIMDKVKGAVTNIIGKIESPVIAKGITVMPGTIGSNISRIIAYLLAIIIVILIILLFIHFFIKPIFKLNPGSPGIIPIPGSDNGKLFWNKSVKDYTEYKDIPETELSIIHDKYFDYTVIMDIFIENPVTISKTLRVLFSRGATYKVGPIVKSTYDYTPQSIFSTYNLVIALKPENTDLIVAVLTNKSSETSDVIASIPNIPIQEPFRLGVVIMELALEIYINGRLMKTIKYDNGFTPGPYQANGIQIDNGKKICSMRNLKIWNKTLTIPEIRYALPAISSVNDFNDSK